MIRTHAPIAHSDGHDAPWLFDEFVPSKAAVVDDIAVGFEDVVGEPVIAHELLDIFDWIELWPSWRQVHQRDVGGYDQFS